MNTSAIRRFAYVAGASAMALMLVEACSDAVGEMMVGAGNMMTDAGTNMRSDAGELLSEAGQALVDAGNQLQVGGSDGQAQSASSYKSGSRIEMRVSVQDGSDGSQFAGYYATPFDTKLNVACGIQRAADGKLRCLPGGLTLGAIFSDAACTKGLAYTVTTLCDVSTAYAVKSDPGACETGGATVHVYSVGAAYSGKAYSLSGTTCTEYPAGSLNTFRFFSVGAEVPADSFVEFSASAPRAI